MKIYHFTLLFLMFLLVIIIRTDIQIGRLKALELEKKELTISLDSATSDAINYLATSGAYGTNKINKDMLVTKFYNSLYSTMGIISDRSKQAEIELYIPVILICDVDGYYLYYYDRYIGSDGQSYSSRVWSEKLPYTYQDENFVYRFMLTDQVNIYDVNNLLGTENKVMQMNYHEIQVEEAYADFRSDHSDSFLLDDAKYELVKKAAIIKQVEESLSNYTNRHNEIARQNGITYNFSFPVGQEEEWAGYMDDVNLLVVFQGYPYGANRDYTYNKVLSAGANVIKRDLYYVAKKSWYLLAHKTGCSHLAESTTVLEETFETIEECAKLGAYCCPECIKHGASVPTIPE